MRSLEVALNVARNEIEIGPSDCIKIEPSRAIANALGRVRARPQNDAE